MIEQRLDALVESMGVRIVETGKLSPDLNACFHAASNTVFVRWGLDPVTRRCAIAHELGHVHSGDTCSTERAERLADEWAAQQLLDIDDVETIAHDVDHSPAAMAAELGVTPHLLDVWMRLYETGRVKVTWNCFENPDDIEALLAQNRCS
ncbi:ImmA/IrrE family metallo-endopeptidase [Corynebacterium lipophiloflavum]|nr:ImmA/IrrE family metallo-endopeptidase [Corynebacterium lipophiloflavum]